MAGRAPTQVELWNGQSGEAWAKSAGELERRLEPFGQPAMDALAPRPGERILDVGCGAGATSRELARLVGATGQVTGVDISGPLLAVARSRGGPVRYLEADAGAATFDTTFDGVFSRFGVMFFDDPRAGFANLRRAAPAGRLTFVCWRSPAENPAFMRPLELVRHLLPETPPVDPEAPGPFSLAAPDRIERVLGEAGWSSVVITPRDGVYELGADPDAATGMALTIGPLSRALREVPEQAEAVRAALHRAFTADSKGGAVAYPAATWIVTAR
jgi:SAM-dependent methyltransferase